MDCRAALPERVGFGKNQVLHVALAPESPRSPFLDRFLLRAMRRDQRSADAVLSKTLNLEKRNCLNPHMKTGRPAPH
jgi:hypothetical protein